MTLARTALRIVTLEALRPTGATTFPTIAKGQVFDSAMTPIDDLAEVSSGPIVVVYTDADNSAAGQHRGGPPFRRTMNLIFELSVIQFDEDPTNPGVYVPMLPASDAETESSLDILEAQIRFALLYGPTGFLFRHLTGSKVLAVDSTSQRSSEEQIRIAMRTVTWRIETADDCFVTTGLPEPFKTIRAALPDGSFGADIIDGMTADLPTLSRGGPFEGVTLNIRAKDPPTAQAEGETPHVVATVETDED